MGDSENNLILAELRKITKLLVLNLNQDRSQNDLITAMSKIGFQPKEIAELIGTTSNTVSVAKAKAKSKSKPIKHGGDNDQQGTSQETS
jgi:hypothetical protein